MVQTDFYYDRGPVPGVYACSSTARITMISIRPGTTRKCASNLSTLGSASSRSAMTARSATKSLQIQTCFDELCGIDVRWKILALPA